jgi:transcriptional regulator with XRE-family HTH domain
MASAMSNLFDELNELVSDEASKVEFKHELALSSFTNELARLMQESGTTQSELARRLGVSRARVSQIMQHVSSPTLRTMVQAAGVFNCDVIPTLVPCGLRPPRLLIADGGKTVAGYRQTRQITDVLKTRALEAERIAV